MTRLLVPSKIIRLRWKRRVSKAKKRMIIIFGTTKIMTTCPLSLSLSFSLTHVAVYPIPCFLLSTTSS